MDETDFKRKFQMLTGHEPMPWQEEMSRCFVNDEIPFSCDLPTGLGKTSVMAIWLIALANLAGNLPRRLVYVVNRRTVVDQATREAEKIRANLGKAGLLEPLKNLCALEHDVPLAISTLRGQFADNGEWCADPARPAIIVGTVDMIGSRLLFSGYGRGFKTRPMHAGFLGQNTLLIHDEAHLEQPFQELLEAIQREQSDGRTPDVIPLRVMALSATNRRSQSVQVKSFELTDEEKNPPATLPLSPTKPIHHVWRRIMASKRVAFHSISSKKDDSAKKIAELALKYKDTNDAVLVFARTVEEVGKIRDKIARDGKHNFEILTGTLRGLERDKLVKTPLFQRFVSPSNRDCDQGAVYLICTAAGEVGVDISADHLVCDLTPFDSMAQRFGRVNRYGDGDAKIDVVYPDALGDKCDEQAESDDLDDQDEQNEQDEQEEKDKKGKKDKKDQVSLTCKRTLALLKKLPLAPECKDETGVLRYDASPKALSELPSEKCWEAFTPAPTILPVTDILFDAWALTTITQKMPGRPQVEPYLHGVAEWQPPETQVAWREEVELITGDLLEFYKPEDLLEDYPLKPHELLRDISERVHKILEKLAGHGDAYKLPVWVVSSQGDVDVRTLGDFVAHASDVKKSGLLVDIVNKTVILPPAAGGLHKGMLTGDSEGIAEDVADEYFDENNNRKRQRVWDDEADPTEMRLIRILKMTPETDEDDSGDDAPSQRCWRWCELPKGADSQESKAAIEAVALQDHSDDVAKNINRISVALKLSDDVAAAMSVAARFHDVGKRRLLWQRSIGNPDPTQYLAKSGRKIRPIEITNYRHEFGSLLDVEQESDFQRLTEDMRNLVMHMIATHHGRARPHFSIEDAFDPERVQARSKEIAAETPRRFARLQRNYGRWGLAYLESLLRAADYAASANPSKFLTATKEAEQ